MNLHLSNVVLGVLAVASASALACSDPAQPLSRPPDQPLVPFPDSITHGNGMPPRAVDSSVVVLGDTLATGTIGTTTVYAGSTSPMQIWASFTVRDTSNHPLDGGALPLAACPFTVSLSRAGDEQVVWRSDRAESSLACPPLQRNSVSDASATWDEAAVLGDSLAPGRYDLTLDVHTSDGRVFHYASRTPAYFDRTTAPSLDYSALQYEASSSVSGIAPRSLETRVVARNTADKLLEVAYGACALNVRLYDNPDRSGTPTWKSELRQVPGSPAPGYACPAVLNVAVLAPGDSLVFPLSIPLYEAPGLPAGHYYVSAELTLDAPPVSGGARSGVKTTIPAGEVDIVRDAELLPSSRTIGGLSYTATTRVIPGDGNDTLRTLVLVQNTSSRPITNSIVAACPVIVYAYRSAAQRDAVPLATPSLSLGPSCSISPQPFTLQPGQSWVFGSDTPMSSIRDRAGAGHYWFTAWLTTGTQILLAAGDAEVS